MVSEKLESSEIAGGTKFFLDNPMGGFVRQAEPM